MRHMVLLLAILFGGLSQSHADDLGLRYQWKGGRCAIVSPDDVIIRFVGISHCAARPGLGLRYQWKGAQCAIVTPDDSIVRFVDIGFCANR